MRCKARTAIVQRKFQRRPGRPNLLRKRRENLAARRRSLPGNAGSPPSAHHSRPPLTAAPVAFPVTSARCRAAVAGAAKIILAARKIPAAHLAAPAGCLAAILRHHILPCRGPFTPQKAPSGPRHGPCNHSSGPGDGCHAPGKGNFFTLRPLKCPTFLLYRPAQGLKRPGQGLKCPRQGPKGPAISLQGPVFFSRRTARGPPGSL